MTNHIIEIMPEPTPGYRWDIFLSDPYTPEATVALRYAAGFTLPRGTEEVALESELSEEAILLTAERLLELHEEVLEQVEDEYAKGAALEEEFGHLLTWRKY